MTLVSGEQSKGGRDLPSAQGLKEAHGRSMNAFLVLDLLKRCPKLYTLPEYLQWIIFGSINQRIHCLNFE